MEGTSLYYRCLCCEHGNKDARAIPSRGRKVIRLVPDVGGSERVVVSPAPFAGDSGNCRAWPRAKSFVQTISRKASRISSAAPETPWPWVMVVVVFQGLDALDTSIRVFTVMPTISTLQAARIAQAYDELSDELKDNERTHAKGSLGMYIFSLPNWYCIDLVCRLSVLPLCWPHPVLVLVKKLLARCLLGPQACADNISGRILEKPISQGIFANFVSQFGAKFADGVSRQLKAIQWLKVRCIRSLHAAVNLQEEWTLAAERRKWIRRIPSQRGQVI